MSEHIILLVRDRKITFYDNNLSAFYIIKYTNVHYNILYYIIIIWYVCMRVKCFFWHIQFASALNARPITRSRILYNCCTYIICAYPRTTRVKCSFKLFVIVTGRVIGFLFSCVLHAPRYLRCCWAHYSLGRYTVVCSKQGSSLLMVVYVCCITDDIVSL